VSYVGCDVAAVLGSPNIVSTTRNGAGGVDLRQAYHEVVYSTSRARYIHSHFAAAAALARAVAGSAERGAGASSIRSAHDR